MRPRRRVISALLAIAVVGFGLVVVGASPAAAAQPLSAGCQIMNDASTSQISVANGMLTIGPAVFTASEQMLVVATDDNGSDLTSHVSGAASQELRVQNHGFVRYDFPVSGTYTIQLAPNFATHTSYHLDCGYPPTATVTVNGGADVVYGQTAPTQFSCSAGSNPVNVCGDMNADTDGSGQVTGLFVGTNAYSVIAVDTHGLSTTTTVTYNVVQASQSVQFTSTAPTTATVGDSYTPTATASSGLPVKFSAGPSSVCTLSGSDVTLAATGQCTVTASQAGNGNYLAATPVTQTFIVSKAATTLNPAPATKGLLGLTPSTFRATLVRTSSGTPISGVRVAFAVAGHSLCSATTNASGTATCLARVGVYGYVFTKTYTASFAGNANYVGTAAVGSFA